MRGIAVNGKALRELRKSLGLTQEQLADRCECDVKTVRSAEHGRHIDAATVRKLADALRVSVASIHLPPRADAAREQNHLQVVRDWQDAFNRRDIDAMLTAYDPSAELILPGPDHVPGMGHYCGTEQLRAQAEVSFAAFDTEPITDYRLFASGNYVWLRTAATATVRATGLRFISDGCHEFLFKNGRVVRHSCFFDSWSL